MLFARTFYDSCKGSREELYLWKILPHSIPFLFHAVFCSEQVWVQAHKLSEFTNHAMHWLASLSAIKFSFFISDRPLLRRLVLTVFRCRVMLFVPCGLSVNVVKVRRESWRWLFFRFYDPSAGVVQQMDLNVSTSGSLTAVLAMPRSDLTSEAVFIKLLRGGNHS